LNCETSVAQLSGANGGTLLSLTKLCVEGNSQ